MVNGNATGTLDSTRDGTYMYDGGDEGGWGGGGGGGRSGRGAEAGVRWEEGEGEEDAWYREWGWDGEEGGGEEAQAAGGRGSGRQSQGKGQNQSQSEAQIRRTLRNEHNGPLLTSYQRKHPEDTPHNGGWNINTPKKIVGGGGTNHLVFGCYSVISRHELIGIAYDGYDWSLLDFCRVAVTERNEARDKSKHIAGKKSGASYNNDHLLSMCLYPDKWREFDGELPHLPPNATREAKNSRDWA